MLDRVQEHFSEHIDLVTPDVKMSAILNDMNRNIEHIHVYLLVGGVLACYTRQTVCFAYILNTTHSKKHKA
jgi:hypothetical protein